jgi:hypothetical protein
MGPLWLLAAGLAWDFNPTGLTSDQGSKRSLPLIVLATW